MATKMGEAGGDGDAVATTVVGAPERQWGWGITQGVRRASWVFLSWLDGMIPQEEGGVTVEEYISSDSHSIPQEALP